MFCGGSGRISEELWEDSEGGSAKLLGKFWEGSGMVLGGFWEDSGRVPHEALPEPSQNLPRTIP